MRIDLPVLESEMRSFILAKKFSFYLAVMLLALLVLPATGWAQATEDSDGDGLSDFHEVHKYLTDPAKKDSDGDDASDDREMKMLNNIQNLAVRQHLQKSLPSYCEKGLRGI